MILVLKPDTAKNTVAMQQLVALAESFPGIKTKVNTIAGQTRSVTEIHLHGPTGTIPSEPFEQFDSVERVVRITEKFRSIGRHGGGLDELGFTYNGVTISQDNLTVFAGLCAVDNRENTEATFRALKEHGIVTTRAGAYKPRTSPYDFQGHGKECLPYVFELAGKYGIKIIAMEVTHEAHIAEIKAALAASGNATGVMLQVGTRNAQNFELLRAVGSQTELPVLIKRGMGITLEESLNAAEYVASSGNHRIIFCLRGVKSQLGEPHRNFVDFAQVPVLRRLTRLPIGIDPSHSVGRKARSSDGLLDIFHVTAQAVIAGANMILVDIHPKPEAALCDGPQALLTSELGAFLDDVKLVRKAYEQRLATIAKR